MSKANPASNAMSVAAVTVVPETLRRLALRALQGLATVIEARAARRAYRELATLDDRLLADIGLDRASVERLAAAGRQESTAALAHFLSSRHQTGQ